MSDIFKGNILIVDDEPDITTVLKTGLQNYGYQVDTFNDPTKAISQFKANYYSLIILDVRMPNIDGFKLARLIWAKDDQAKICFLTAFEVYEAEARKVFRDFKTYCFIKKPIMPTALSRHIEAHLMPVSRA